MLRTFGVANSDEITRNDMKFTIKALESGYSGVWNKGIPSYVNHDRTKPLGWSYMRSLYFEPGLVRTTSSCEIPENEYEMKNIEEKMKSYFEEYSYTKSKSYIDELKNRVKEHLSDDYKICSTGCVGIIDSGIVRRVFPSLFDSTKKHELIDVKELNPVLPGVFEKDGLLIFAHQYFRRSFSRMNTLNSEFLSRFQEISSNEKIKAQIAIDEDMIGVLGTEHEEFEFQYWWGPKFNADLSKIPAGVTIHKNDEKEMTFNDIAQTEFFWYEQDSRKTLECEEIIEVPNLDREKELIGCRYIHSMLEMGSSIPVHLDGAVRVYDIEKMLIRLDSHLDSAEKNTIYKKLWRLDGDIPIEKWKELISHYYRDNRLIGEYFDGEDKIKDFTPRIIENKIEKTPIEKYIPYNLNEDDGIRLAITYSNKSTVKESDYIKIRPNQSIYIDSNMYRYIESDTFEIIKELKKQGKRVKLPLPSTIIVAFEDTVINFPTLMHRGKKSVEMANETNKAIRKLCNSWLEKHHDRTISYSICVEYEDREVTYSVAGHNEDIVKWLNNPSSKFPSKIECISDWCEKFAEYLYTYEKANDNPKLGELIDYNGIISFKRKWISNPKFKWDDKKKVVMIEAAIENNKSLVKEIKNRGLEIAPILLINETICMNCGKVYQKCSCSKYLEPNGGEKMKDFKYIGAFWTNRKA